MAVVDGVPGDLDAVETSEWLAAIDSVLEHDGPGRARHILTRVVERAQHAGTGLIATLNTPYVNNDPSRARGEAARRSGAGAPAAVDRPLERHGDGGARQQDLVRARRPHRQLPIAATLYEVGFNHFWYAASESHSGDLVYFQGHSSPGNYARAFLESRLTAEQLDGFRQEVSKPGGLSSYPHPWLMPDFWQFSTVSLGIGPITSIYQAQFMKYLQARRLAKMDGRKVWCFVGDGEVDEPETMARSAWPGGSGFDNLIWVVNCNLQRLDGPVRGNGKIIQELESDFRGAGWNVIKVIWGAKWDPLLAQDTDGRLVKVMEDCVDGEYQTYKSRDGAYVREHFFGKDPVLLERVKEMSDEEIWLLNRGGLDQQKVYAAYCEGGSAHRTADGNPRQDDQGLRDGRLWRRADGHPPGEEDDRGGTAGLPRPVRAAAHRRAGARGRVLQAPEDSAEMRYLRECREKLGGSLPVRRRTAEPLEVPALETFKGQLEGTGEREISTTMAFVRVLARCCATSRSAATSSRSSPTSRARSGWRVCSARSGSTPRSGSYINPRTRRS